MKHEDRLLAMAVFFCGQKVTLVCDGKCEKAWGINGRPKIRLDSDDEDDVIWLADDELGLSPERPGTRLREARESRRTIR